MVAFVASWPSPFPLPKGEAKDRGASPSLVQSENIISLFCRRRPSSSITYPFG